MLRPDGLSDRGFFYRSDQFSFARHGVPPAYFASGQEFIGRNAVELREAQESGDGDRPLAPLVGPEHRGLELLVGFGLDVVQ